MPDTMLWSDAHRRPAAELRPIDPAAPFDPAAWLEQAEARGYKISVVWDLSSSPPRHWFYSAEPCLHGEQKATDDLDVWRWLSPSGAVRKARQTRVVEHIERTRGIDVYGPNERGWKVTPEFLAGRGFDDAAAVLAELEATGGAL